MWSVRTRRHECHVTMSPVTLQAYLVFFVWIEKTIDHSARPSQDTRERIWLYKQNFKTRCV